MDGICCAILDKMTALGGTGRYFIVSAEEFLEVFPAGAERSYAELEKALKYLCAAGYLDIKYTGGELYCAALIKPRPCGEEKPKTAAAEVAGSSPVKITKPLFIFLAAFAGGALGGIVTALISLLFLLC